VKKLFNPKLLSIKSGLILFSLVPSFVLLCLISVTLSHSQWQKELTKAENKFTKAVMEINSTMEQAMNFSTNTVSNAHIISIFDETQTGMNKNYETFRSLDMFFSNYHEKKESAQKNITIYHDNYSMYRSAFSDYIDALEPKLLTILMKQKSSENLWIEDKGNHYLYKTANSPKHTIIMEYRIPGEKFDEIFNKFDVYTNDTKGYTNSIKLVSSSKESYNEFQRSLLNGKTAILKVPKSLMIHIYLANFVIFLAAFALLASVLILFANLFSGKFKQKLTSFVDALADTSTQTVYQLQGERDNVLSPIYDKIVNLIHQINELNTKNNQITQEKNIIELKYVQSQFNPHLLYNTLSVLKWECVKYDAGLGNTIDSMVDYYRSCISDYSEVVELGEEITLIKNYLSLMEFVHKRAYPLLLNIDEKLMNLQTTKHILQPFVENSILHGIQHKPEGYIKIEGTLENDFAVIKIMDNGTGIDKNKMNEIKNDNYFSKYKSYGIKNTKERIRLFHGEESSLKVESRDTGGTCVTIKVPVGKFEDTENIDNDV